MRNESTGPFCMFATEGLAKGRVEAPADGIMAVAMTILVLDIEFDGTETITTDGHLLHFMPRTIDGQVARWLERPRR